MTTFRRACRVNIMTNTPRFCINRRQPTTSINQRAAATALLRALLAAFHAFNFLKRNAVGDVQRKELEQVFRSTRTS
jgi:hypothetical protein